MKAKLAGLVVLALVSVLTACATTDRAAPPGEREGELMSADTSGIDPASVTGIWQGVIKAGGQEVRLVFHLGYENDAWTATVDSPDQGANGIPAGTVTLEAGKIVIDVPNVRGRYEGVVQEGGTAILGKWLQAGGAFAVDLARIEAVEKVRRPQDPVPPYPYEERDVRFRNETAGITLAGTLTLPREGRPVPAVVLVTGSGAQNRNEEIMNHRPFLVLADYLSRRGIAVLRFDDRGVPPSEGDPTLATSRDFAEDALAAFRFLCSQPEVDAARAGIAGHSEGGIIAPMLAAEHPEVAFIVLLAGPGFRGYDILLQQSAAILRAGGGSEEQIAQAAKANRSIYDAVLAESDNAKAEAQIRTILADLGVKGEAADAQLAALLSPWYRFFLSYDPAGALRRTSCPVLALNGSLDLQVPADLNLAAIATALTEGGNARVTTLKLDGLNHLFQHATTGMVQEYITIEETFAPEALEAIASWVLENAAK